MADVPEGVFDSPPGTLDRQPCARPELRPSRQSQRYGDGQYAVDYGHELPLATRWLYRLLRDVIRHGASLRQAGFADGGAHMLSVGYILIQK